MLASIGQFETFDIGDRVADATTAARAPARRAVRHGETLFAEGDPRTAAYRIVEGGLCHYLVWPDGPYDVIEFAFPGDVVGLGFLPDHISTAQAMVDTVVVRLDETELAKALTGDAALAARLASAADREFEFVRQRALGRGQRAPLQRVASYLLAVARHGCRSGEPVVVATSDREDAALANLLEIGLGELKAALADLEARGLIAAAPAGLVLRDAAALERLADT